MSWRTLLLTVIPTPLTHQSKSRGNKVTVEPEPKCITPEIVYIWIRNKTLTELTKQYRILISYESEGQRLDIKTISVKMKEEGMSNLRIEEKPPIGKIYTVEIYFDADIPISKTSMTQIMRGQDLQLKVLQEVHGNNGEWINVDKTLPTTCQAESCKNPPEMTAKVQKKDGKKKMYLICKHHANLVSMGIYFNVVDESD